MGKDGVGPNFTEVTLAPDGTTLLVLGNSTSDPGSEVRVAIHAVNDVHKRLEGEVPPPIETSWHALFNQPREAFFGHGDMVVVVGREISKEGKSFMWANQLEII
jgi:hypothetical protein